MSDRKELAEKIYIAMIANNAEGKSIFELDAIPADELAARAIGFADIFLTAYRKRNSEDSKKPRAGISNLLA